MTSSIHVAYVGYRLDHISPLQSAPAVRITPDVLRPRSISRLLSGNEYMHFPWLENERGRVETSCPSSSSNEIYRLY